MNLRTLTTARARRSRGFSLIEVIVFMAVIALVAGAFTVSAIAATRSQSAHKSVDIASQASAGLLERAQATPWANLGFRTTDPGYTATYEGRTTVTLPTAPTGTRVMPVTTTVVKGVTVTLTTYITWLRGPVVTDGRAYGTKRVTTIASWSEKGTTRTARYSIDRTSQPNEALPDATVDGGPADPVPSVAPPVPSPSGDANGNDEDGTTGYEYDGWDYGPITDEGDAPPCVAFTVTGGYARATFAWTPVPGASYRLYIDGTQVAAPGAGSSTYTYVGLTAGTHSFRVDTVKYGVASTGCTTKPAVVQTPPPMTCPTLTITTTAGTATLTWTRVTAADQYVIYRNGALARSVSDPATSTTFTSLTPGNHTFRIDAKLMSDTSPGCATQTVFVPAPVPDCPTVSVSTDIEAEMAVATWPQVADATSYKVYLDGSLVATLSHTGTGTNRSHVFQNLPPGSHTAKVNVVGLTGIEHACGTQTFTQEANVPVCPGFTTTVAANGNVTVNISSAARVDTYIVTINGKEVARIAKSGVPTSRTFVPASWNYVYGNVPVTVLGHNATTGLTTEGCKVVTLNVPWPTVAECPPAPSGFTAVVSGRRIVGQVARSTSVNSYVISVKNAAGTQVWTGTLGINAGSWSTGDLTAGTYTATLTVDNPNSPPTVCTPVSVTMPPLEISDTFSGAGALGVTEVGAKTYLYPNGATWSRTGGYGKSTTAIGSNPMAVVDAGVANIDLTVNDASGGEAAYFRVVDANNWLRARAAATDVTTSYQYYNTEYQWTSYTTEYLYNDMRWVPQWQEAAYATYRTQTSYTYSGWSGWGGTGNTTACRTSYPGYGTFSDYDGYGMEVGQRSWSGYFTCSGGGIKYEQIYRSRYRYSTGSSSSWYFGTCTSSDSAYSSVSCGSTQAMAIGGTYYAFSSNGGPDWQTGGGQSQNFGQYWATGARDGDDTYAGSSRQVATGTYWSSSWCSGCPTRQVGPYTGYTTTTEYKIVVSKAVAGTITDLATYNLTAMPANLRVVANGNQLTVRYNTGTLAGTLTETAHQTATRHGVGYAGPTKATPPGINSFRLVEVP